MSAGRVSWVAVGLVLIAVTATSPAHAALFGGADKERVEAIQQEVEALDERLARMERVIENQSLLEVLGRIEEIHGEIRTLRGEIEELRHEVDSARERQRDLYLDLDRRLRALELGGSAGAAGLPAAPSGASGSDQGGGPSADTGTDAGGAESDDEAGSDTEFYRATMDQLREGRYEEARERFRDFLRRFPDSGLRDNAQYWLGETHYVVREHEAAIEAFRGVVDDYPDSDKRADALLKIGFSLYELSRFEESRSVLEDLISEFEGESAASTQVNLARQRLDRLRSEGR